jgi:hypothetical protein
MGRVRRYEPREELSRLSLPIRKIELYLCRDRSYFGLAASPLFIGNRIAVNTSTPKGKRF